LLWRLTKTIEACLVRGKALPVRFNPDAIRKHLESEAKFYGYDPKHLQYIRSDPEKALDAVASFVESPDSLLEMSEDMLDAMERTMTGVVVDAADQLNGKLRDSGWEEGKYEGFLDGQDPDPEDEGGGEGRSTVIDDPEDQGAEEDGAGSGAGWGGDSRPPAED